MELSPKQDDVLVKFRKAVSDVKKACEHDEYLLQWLRARNFKLEKAEKMLRKSMAWRESIGADNLVDSWEPPEVLSKYKPISLIGNDKEGCPVWMATGRLDVIGLQKSSPVDEIVKYCAQLLEVSRREMAKQSQERGKFVGQIVAIIDLEHLTFRNATYPPGLNVIKKLIKMQDANYPETLKKVVVVNAPKFGAFVFNLLKPVLNEHTRKKIFLYDSDRTKWVPAILELIDADQLPKHWGGTMVDPDGNPMCPSKVNHGVDIPKSYYMSKNKSSKTDEESEELMETATIKKCDKLEKDVYIAQSGSEISWKIRTESHDIGFGIFSVDGNNERQEVLPCTRLDSCDTILQGETHPLDEGKYVVILDNSYSNLKEIRVQYTIEVLPPSSEDPTELAAM